MVAVARARNVRSHASHTCGAQLHYASLAHDNAADSREVVLTVARELLRFMSERVRLRVADALLRRAQARLVAPAQRLDMLCLLEPSIALERHTEVYQ